MFKKILITAILAFSVSLSASAQNVLAKLDGQDITKKDISAYVENVLGEKYMPLTKTEEGLHQLTKHYINREMLLQYAKKTIKSDNKFLKEKGAQVDEDTKYLTAVLNKEVQDKVEYTEDDIEEFSKSNGMSDLKQAEVKYGSIQRKKLFDELMQKLKAEHTVEFM